MFWKRISKRESCHFLANHRFTSSTFPSLAFIVDFLSIELAVGNVCLASGVGASMHEPLAPISNNRDQ